MKLVPKDEKAAAEEARLDRIEERMEAIVNEERPDRYVVAEYSLDGNGNAVDEMTGFLPHEAFMERAARRIEAEVSADDLAKIAERRGEAGES